MRRRLKQAACLLIVFFVAAQFVRPGRSNPTTDPGRTIQAHVDPSSGLAPVLDRACRDCHSNNTVWPWYTQIAPVSWLMAEGVAAGRKVQTRLSPQDIETICAAARVAEARAAEGRGNP